MIREFKGNLFDSEAKIIGHGCNCLGLFGAGLALQMANRYPEMREEYMEECDAKRFNPGDVFFYKANDFWIANMATQYYPGRNAKIEYIIDSTQNLIDFALDNSIEKVSIPRLGSGIGGLAWDDVLQALEEEFGRHNVDIDIYYL
jgi:O-acetyl-ADP-ribose deacetylase (regulator of RNase III)